MPCGCHFPRFRSRRRAKWLEQNRKYASLWPNIPFKKAPPADAGEWNGVKDKFEQHFSEKPGEDT
jgi:ferredoxin